MQNEVDKKRLAQLSDMTAKRRDERESNFPNKEKAKEKTPKPSSNTPSEKYKQMVSLRIFNIKLISFQNRMSIKLN